MNTNDMLNPMANVYHDFVEILKNVTIKYSYIAESNEREDAKSRGDEYLDSYNKRDSYLNYSDYLYEDYIAVGLTDSNIISEAMRGNNEIVPIMYRDALLNIRRKRVINNYEELNNYYRMLNGYPDLVVSPYDETKLATNDYDRYYINPDNLFYVPENIAKKYGLMNLYNDRIPIHLIQDHYNKIRVNLGDDYISILEGSGYIKSLIDANPDIEYLKYLGSYRISVLKSREAKNFQILQLPIGSVKYLVYNQFLQVYEQCRQYFMDVVFIREFRSFFENYDRFIAMSIMVMTLQQVIMKQLQLTVNREFFDIYAVRLLYQAYGLPYNLDLDEDTQSRICQNLNKFIQLKATDKGLYNIAEVLGFSNGFNIYKYYLSKEPKTDAFGIPIVKYKKVFNNDTGEVEIQQDVENMYNIFFHREDLNKVNFINSFNLESNNFSYEEITEKDPYWINDSKLIDLIYNAEYNYVESKYLGVSISYKLTDLMFENLILLKTVIKEEDNIKELRVRLPKITGDIQVSLFDIIIGMICLTSVKNHLSGEILSLPTDILSYLDYMTNLDAGTDYLVDTFSFNFEYFLEPDWERSWWLNKKALKVVSDSYEEFDSNTMVKYSDVINKIPDIEIGEYVIDKMTRLYQYLSDEDIERIKSYINILTINKTYTPEQKRAALNELLSDIRGFQKFIDYKMTSTGDMKLYSRLKDLSRTIFYSKEVRDVFTVHLGDNVRTAHNYFEYLYYKNPTLYNAMFEVDTLKQYEDFVSKRGQYERLLSSYQLQYLRYYHVYCNDHNLNEEEFTIDDYKMTYTYWQFTTDIYKGDLEPLKSTNYKLADFNNDIDRHYVHFYTEAEISYDEFMEAANAGEYIDDDGCHYPIYIKYDTMIGTSEEDRDTRNEKVYFFLTHMVSRLEALIDDVNYLYSLGDATTPLQELLMKFIKFFKSYTVEMISTDIIVTVDMKNGNDIRLFDIPKYVQKLLLIKDHINIAYSDVIRLISIINKKDTIRLNDRSYYDDEFVANIDLSENLDIYDWYRLVKELLIKENLLSYDLIHNYNSEFIVNDRVLGENDNSLLRDSIIVTYTQ